MTDLTVSRRRRRAVQLLGLLGAVSMTAVAVALIFSIYAPRRVTGPVLPSPPAVTTPTPTTVDGGGPLPPPPKGVWLGAWVQPTVPGPFAQMNAVTAFEARLGRTLAIDNRYYPWSAPFRGTAERWDITHGRIPMISWGSTNPQLVASGAVDQQIISHALVIRSLPGPVFLRFAWEMDARPKQWDPAAFIAAWRHVHDVFAREGVHNVSWVWCPTSGSFLSGRAQQFYPGGQYVDWIGADGYAAMGNAPYRSVQQIFGAFYQFGTAERKPMVIGEFGVQERGLNARAQWIDSFGQALSRDFPLIRAVVYFDSNKVEHGQVHDWRLTSSPNALTAFSRLAHSPYFNAPVPNPA